MAKKGVSQGILKGFIILFAFLIIGGFVAIIFVLQYYEDTNPKKEAKGPGVNEIIESGNEVIDFDYPEFNSSKVIKSTDDVDSKIKYEIKTSDPQGMFSAIIRDDKVYIQKKDTTGIFESTYTNSKMENDKLYEIGNIDKKVIDIHIGYCGNGIVNPILLILTEDGSLRHVKLVDAIANGTYAASDVILKKVVRIEDVVVSKNNVETNSIVLITEDGNIYDIANII